MNKFRKKPVVIEAIQWNGQNEFEIQNFIKNGNWTWQANGTRTPDLYVHTLEGKMFASIGDWIIKGDHNEFYPCKPDIFEKTYEKVNE